ncbi:MAG: hypothetical protein ACON4H_09580 [Rubripirellula sp.]
MRLALMAFQLAHLVSLDVFCIAFAWCSLVLVEISGQAVEIWQPLVISSAVWIAYTIDRLNDGRSLDRSRPHWSRHMFHHHYNKFLWACLALVFSAVAVVIQSKAIFLQVCLGLSLTAFVGLYFWLHGRGGTDAAELWRPVAVGALFSCGVCLPSMVIAGSPVRAFLVMFCLGSLFTFNTMTVSWLESGVDHLQSGHGGGSHRFWKRFVLLAAIIAQLIGLLLVIGVINLSSVFKLTYLGASLLLALNCVAFGCLKRDSRLPLRESSFVLQLIDASDATRPEHVGSCFAEATLWAPAVVALCWGV